MTCQRQPRVHVTAEPSDGPIDLLCRDSDGVTVTWTSSATAKSTRWRPTEEVLLRSRLGIGRSKS